MSTAYLSTTGAEATVAVPNTLGDESAAIGDESSNLVPKVRVWHLVRDGSWLMATLYKVKWNKVRLWSHDRYCGAGHVLLHMPNRTKAEVQQLIFEAGAAVSYPHDLTIRDSFLEHVQEQE